MRERLDCAVLSTRCTEEWITPFLGPHSGGRLYIHELSSGVDVEAQDASAALLSAAMTLRRYDACLVPVSPATLPWARISLSRAMPQLQTPVIGLVRDLTAAALHDLYELGMSDFLRVPFCNQEVRIRVERLLDGRRTGVAPFMARKVVADAASAMPYVVGRTLWAEHPPSSSCTADSSDPVAYAVAAASRSDPQRESFRDAKRQVVDRFERTYITTALSRHGGNIAMAARAAQKHRRAFWALMRKHEINAEGFRRFPAVSAMNVDALEVAAAGACRHRQSKATSGTAHDDD